MATIGIAVVRTKPDPHFERMGGRLAAAGNHLCIGVRILERLMRE